MPKQSSLPGFLPRSMRELRNGMILFACVLSITIAGTSIHINSARAAAGQIVKIAASDGGTTFYVGRCFRTNFNIQTDTLDANSIDLIIPYNPTYVQPYSNSGCTSVATQIITHPVFPSYPSNSISGNEILLTGYDSSGSSPVDTGAAPADQTVGYVYWKVLAENASYSLAYDYTPNLTTDTNMAENNGDGTDVLDAVENATFNFAPDTTAPTFSTFSPSNGATGVSVTSGISFLFLDAGAGVNSGSLTTGLNGTNYAVTKSGCTTTNSNRKPQCTASISSGVLGTLSYNTLYRVTATGGDLAVVTNTGSTSWTFTTEDDVDAPYVENETPADNATGVAISSNIQFNIKDYKGNAGVTPGLGVDTSTIEVTVTVGGDAPVTYQSGDAEFSISGIAANRTVVINPAVNFPENTLITVSVEASDLHVPGNAMATHTYSFRTVDSAGPSITDYSPVQGATGIAADTNISFTISDDGAGVDIGNTTVTVEGVAYTSASPQFSYTGTTASYVITINPSSNFAGAQVVDVSISTRDLASPTPNVVSSSYSFTIENSCTTCSVDTEDPARFSTTATLDDTVSFHVKDTQDGIDSDSIRITLIGSPSAVASSPLVLTGSSPAVNITGTSADYTVTVTLSAAIAENVAYSIMIEAEDVNGLEMSAVGYTFMNLNVTPTTSGGGGTCTEEEEDVQTGGRRRSTDTILNNIESINLPTIIRRRMWNGKMIEETLTPEEAGSINKCYIDESGRPAAPLTHYSDVPAGIWYEEAAQELLEDGVLDASQKTFRADDSALRSEFAKVLVKIAGITDPVLPAVRSFDDTDQSAWYYPYVEEAGKQTWMKGYDNCYGTHPCTLMPAAAATRAEAIAMIMRYYGFSPTNAAPRFADVSIGAWYANILQAAADRCIVQGDDLTGLVAPDRVVNRAEMITLFARARQNMVYGKDCGVPNATPTGSNIGASLLQTDTAPSAFDISLTVVLLALFITAPFVLKHSMSAPRHHKKKRASVR